jgi:hypothetical protein
MCCENEFHQFDEMDKFLKKFSYQLCSISFEEDLNFHYEQNKRNTACNKK